MSFVLLPEYKEAIKSIINNPVTFVSGPAGSGKSTFIRYIQGKIKNSILVAPTGIAAINIGGRTIHSFFKIPAKFVMEGDIKRLDPETQAFLRMTSLIIIDEISMVSSNLMDALDSSLQKNLGNDKPFGGIHILLVGDLFQLPPVVNDLTENIFYDYYDSPMFFDSYIIQNIMKEGKMGTVKLKQVMRQKDNKFVDILNNIRMGIDLEDSIDELNLLVNYNDQSPKGYVQITPYKEVSDLTNDKKLKQIDSQVKTYFGDITGNFSIKNCPVNQTLMLKVGAQVMISKNLSDNIVNGTVGQIKELHDDHVIVDVNGANIEIYRSKWEEYGYSKVKSGYESNIIGSFTQIPLKLAWSLTIHKVQSATIEKLHIDMNKGAFAPGMLYVALSRAVSIQGLSTTKPFDSDDVMIDPHVLNFYNGL